MSFEELGGIDHTIDQQSNTSEGQEHLIDQMRETVAEQARQSKVVAGQIKKNHSQNIAYAQFLTFLLGTLQSDELINTLYKLFFTTKDPYHGTVYIRKSSNYPVLIGLFVPFFRTQIVEYKMTTLYHDIYDPKTTMTITTYIHYLKALAYKMHDKVALDQQLLMQCIILIVKEFHIINSDTIDEIQLKEIQLLIQKELF